MIRSFFNVSEVDQSGTDSESGPYPLVQKSPQPTKHVCLGLEV